MDQTKSKMKQKADKGPVVISQEDAGYNVIVALDNCRKKSMASGVSMSRLMLFLKQRNCWNTPKISGQVPKSSNAADVLYLAGNITIQPNLR